MIVSTGDQIRKKREDLGISQVKFRELIGISVTHIRNIERNRWSIATLRFKTVMKISSVLGWSLDYLKSISGEPL